MNNKGFRKGLAYTNGYKRYKLDNRAETNKIKKLVSHCKKYPEDTMASTALVDLKKKGYTPRAKPKVPGSNKPDTVQNILSFSLVGLPPVVESAREQIARLLGIKLPKARPYRKPKIITKRTRVS